MAAADIPMATLERNWGMVDRAIEGLGDDVWNAQPNDQSNSIAWLLWHMTRVVDTFVNTRFRSHAQLWEQDGWNEKCGMASESGTGQGMSSEEIAAWPAPSRDALIGYYEAVKVCAREWLGSVTDADLAGTITLPNNPEPRPVSDMLGTLVYDNTVHGGQIAYLRGYYGGLGWFV